MEDRRQALQVLILNTVAFTVCFAGWMMNGVLITFLVDNDVFAWDKAQMGWLIGIPVLTGSIMRLPVGVLTDKYGGRRVYTILMLISAIPMYMTSMANEYYEFLGASLGFGLTGAAFAVGIAYTSVWFPKERQGTALGIFGVGNAGSALTSMGAPILLRSLTNGGTNLDAWRTLPKIYALALVIMAVIFYFLTYEKRTPHSAGLSLRQRLEPLKYMRVWRFGLYYFLVFGAFVALAQWLIPYYVNVYTMSVAYGRYDGSHFQPALRSNSRARWLDVRQVWSTSRHVLGVGKLLGGMRATVRAAHGYRVAGFWRYGSTRRYGHLRLRYADSRGLARVQSSFGAPHVAQTSRQYISGVSVR
jgi:NNP family nitrate/nitrite transporter-like MFS transporter